MVLLIALLLYASTLLLASLIGTRIGTRIGARSPRPSPDELHSYTISEGLRIFIESYVHAFVLRLYRFRSKGQTYLQVFLFAIRQLRYQILFGRGILHG